MSVGGSKSKSKSQQQSSSTQLSPEEVAAYTTALDDLSGGRVGSFFEQGGSPVQFNPLSTQQLQSFGGMGTTQIDALRGEQERALGDITADPSMTLAQRQRASQLTNQDFADRLSAINAETEAAIAQQAGQDAISQAQLDAAEQQRLQDEIALLANIYFGGSGTESQSTGGSSGRSSSLNLGFS